MGLTDFPPHAKYLNIFTCFNQELSIGFGPRLDLPYKYLKKNVVWDLLSRFLK